MIGLLGPLVDGVVGPLPEGGSSSTGPVYAGPEYDISVGGLGFNLWPDSERPYERATAKFRKDQLDIGQSAGDQSLTGYWTRGQAAFHGGAGIKYYDVTGDEETTTRYRDSTGVDPFTSLGEVSLDRAFEQVSPTAHSIAVPTPSGASVATPDGVYHRDGSFDPFSLAGSGTAVAVASGPSNVFVARGSVVNKVTGTTGASYVTHGDGKNWTGVWVVKGRLLLVDDAGAWFTYPLNTAAGSVTTTTDAVWSSGQLGWAVCETPGFVLLGCGSTIYALTVKDDGTFVTIEAPVVAAQLPPGEWVNSLGSVQGVVVITTSKGLRMAQTSGLQVGYGPLILREPMLTLSQGYGDGKVWLSTTAGATVTVSLEQPLTDRIWPYAMHSTTPGWAGFTVDGKGDLVRFGAGGIEWLGDELVPSGFVETGLHRFGTLERKKFQSVTVRAGGAGGTLRVTRVYVDGSEAPLHSFEVGEFSSVTIDLREDDPLELLGLRFSLERSSTDPTKGPVFQGYQLRALPAPQRQRLIRLPLMLFDVERNAGTGRPTGNDGAAWRRLAALEALESSGGTHMYLDRRTDEIGEVFIESVEHTGVTSPKVHTSGYGGIVFVTLRLLN